MTIISTVVKNKIDISYKKVVIVELCKLVS